MVKALVKLMRLSATIAVVCTSSMVATAIGATYTFTGDVDSDWHRTLNWDFGIIPERNDTAIIPDELVCDISNADAEIGILEIYGRLNLIGRQLDIYGGSGDSIIDGLDVDNGIFSLQNSPTVKLLNSVTFDNAAYTGRILGGVGADIATWSRDTSVRRLGIASGITVRGSMNFDGVNVENNGTMLVNNSGHVMTFGSGTNAVEFFGSGTLQVSAGLAVLDFVTSDFDADWTMTLNGGEIHVADTSLVSATDMNLAISGGTLDIDANFGGKGFTFSGGTIEVAAGKSAQFVP